MGPSRSRAPRRRRHPVRRYVFLALLLLALGAPAGWVLGGEMTQPYVVVFDAQSVSAVGQTGHAVAPPAFLRAALADEQAADPADQIDAGRVVSHVRQIAAVNHVQVGQLYSNALGGFSANLSPGQLMALQQDPTIAAIVPDTPIELDDATARAAGSGIRTTANPPQRVPPGIRRVGAGRSNVAGLSNGGSGVDADVAIIDTGIDRDHPDLNVVGGYNCTSRNRDKWDDDDGHGTHVAGIVGGMGRAGGVVGVAPGVRLWSVKVLNSKGRGYLSWMVCGVDWVTAQRQRGTGRPLFEVANMSISFSLGGGDRQCGATDRDMLHEAICRSVKAGTVYVVAAGNESHNAGRNRPAAYDEVITVAAIADYDGRGGGRGRASDSCPYWSPDRDDALTSFSNYGADVDLVAPGRCILSTFLHGRYAWLSGTSMAAPHVTGAVAVYRTLYPRATPHQVQLALESSGTLDWRTSSDPYKGPQPRAVWIGDFRGVPDFSVTASSNGASAAPGERLSIDVSIGRAGGFSDPVRVALANPPAGFDASPITVKGSSGSLAVSVSRRVAAGSYSLTISATSGDVQHSASVTVVVHGRPPQAAFVSPRDGLTLQSSVAVAVSWTESSGGAPISGRTLERQVARVRTPGTCEGVRYSTDVVRTNASGGTDRTAAGYCYRWRLTLTDQDGNRTTIYSGDVLVDSSAPASPSVELAGTAKSAFDLDRLGVDAVYIDRAGTIWVRGGQAGSIMLDVTASDPESGIVTNSAVVGTSGWHATWIGGSVNGALRLTYFAGARDATLRVSSTNGAGLRGPETTAALERDSAAPSPVAWTSLPTGSTFVTTQTAARLRWTGGADSGSGLAAQQLIRRYRSPINARGACRPGGWQADGPYRLAANGEIDSGLVAGYCYAWAVRTLDNVGNASDYAVSGLVVVDSRRD